MISGDVTAEQQMDRVWKALADPNRRALLDALATRAQTTGALVLRFPDLCRTAVMKHLGILEVAGLVMVRRQGRVRWNQLNPMPIQRIYDRWVAGHLRGMASAMSRLKDHVENTPRPQAAKSQPPKPTRRNP